MHLDEILLIKIEFCKQNTPFVPVPNPTTRAANVVLFSDVAMLGYYCLDIVVHMRTACIYTCCLYGIYKTTLLRLLLLHCYIESCP